jgi:pimeloyl-ACP methyl ester carboxylesterase
MRPGAGEALGAVFDATLPPDQHMDAVRFAFFAPGNDPEVRRDGWYPAVARMQTAATKASRVEEWWGAGKARLLVVVGLQDVVAPPENGRLIKDEFGDRVTLQEIDGAGHLVLHGGPMVRIHLTNLTSRAIIRASCLEGRFGSGCGSGSGKASIADHS